MNKLAILGASGHGKVVADVAEQCHWHSIAFFDDAWPAKTKIGNWQIIGTTETLISSLTSYDRVFVAIGDNYLRKEKIFLLQKAGAPLSKLIHPSAVISKYATVGLGTVIMPGVIVNTDTVIGAGVILNSGCTVDHDCRLGDIVHISPGANLAGNVSVGAMSWIGIAASTRQGVVIGAGVTVGAGAVVVNDLPDGVTAVGVPARY